MREFQILGRLSPTPNHPNPKIYRMRIFGKDSVRAESKFWYFLNRIYKIKRANGQLISVNEIFEKKPKTVKTFGVFIRYDSRSGTHNIYKEYRDVTRNGAVATMYQDMAGRHRARAPCIQILRVQEVAGKDVRREYTKQYLNSRLHFPLAHRRPRVDKRFRKTFKATRPRTHF
eukprot:TRINITY_DN2670_c1_g3_i1.p2 TRINITY_DN2670_c1_g3~~TRINITY_DN2670_c1_g3_i1.p2  ORF type:complete len:173 (+),score=30.21 TRINITY_DN2670_c1_g3_i1:56-574(+)